MRVLRLACGLECRICCRYAEMQPGEFIADPGRFAVGVRVSLDPVPRGLRKWRLRRELGRMMPEIDGFFANIRIVDAGFSPEFEGRCPDRTEKKERCRGEMLLMCRARPLDPLLPAWMQPAVIDFASRAQGCAGFSKTAGNAVYGAGWLATKLLGTRAEAYHKIRQERLEHFGSFEAVAHMAVEMFGMQELASCSGRNIFHLLPATALVRGLYEAGKATAGDAVRLVAAQKARAEKDLEAFLAKYGEKRLFAEKKRSCGDSRPPSRGRYVGRMSMWIGEYGKTLKKLTAAFS